MAVDGDEVKLISAGEAAELLLVSYPMMLRMLSDGTIPTESIIARRPYQISVEILLDWLRKHPVHHP